MTDFATVLTHSKLPLAKTWQLDGSITPYSTARYFKTREHPLESFDDLANLLEHLATDPYSCLIRGRYKGAEYAAQHETDHKPRYTQRQMDLHDDAPHQWLLVEVDEFVPIGCDPATHPELAIEEYVASCLPPAFQDVSCHWQLSNSAGHLKHIGKLKAHLWFWMDTAYTSERLRAWAKALSLQLDYSVMNPIQVNYTSAPLFAEGVTDPIYRRSGTMHLATDTVPLSIPDIFPSQALKPSKREQLEFAHQADPIAQRLYETHMVKSVGKAGELFVECPCSERHTSDSAETTTLYYPANTGGYAQGNFKCLHGHCIDAPQSDFTLALGFSPADDFEDVGDTIPDDLTPAARATGADRFRPIAAHLFAVDTPTAWHIKYVLPAAELIIIYGASGSGKSFMALDMACAIAQGADWRGIKTKKGRVAYVCAEGAGGFRKRLQAYASHHQIALEDIDVFVVPATPNLMKGDDVRDLVRALHALGPLSLVIIDTLAQTMAGGNENSGEDMGLAISQCRVLGSVLKTTVVMIHHSGKDDSKGARGHSSLKAAADAELEVARNDNDRALKVSKQKDGEEGQEYGFQLVTIVLGHDEDGDPITSCAVLHNNGTMSAVKKRGKAKGANEMFLMDAFNELCLSPEMGVSEMEVIDKAIELKGEPESARARSNMKTNLIRALRTLVRDEMLVSDNGMVTMLERE